MAKKKQKVLREGAVPEYRVIYLRSNLGHLDGKNDKYARRESIFVAEEEILVDSDTGITTTKYDIPISNIAYVQKIYSSEDFVSFE